MKFSKFPEIISEVTLNTYRYRTHLKFQNPPKILESVSRPSSFTSMQLKKTHDIYMSSSDHFDL